jgi:hypothetical protein
MKGMEVENMGVWKSRPDPEDWSSGATIPVDFWLFLA